MSDIIETYRKIGVDYGKTVYITGNFGRLGFYQTKEKVKIFNAHFEALSSLLGRDGTLVFPTHSFSLCNTDTIFDVRNTPSETGPFTEYLRKKAASRRQLHPYSSSSAIGSKAEYYCDNNGLHVYDIQSPFHRMVEDNALFLSVGMPPQQSVSLVHYVEFMMGVPYRYVKEFPHFCKNSTGKLQKFHFYLHALYQGMLVERDRNKKIFQNFERHSTVSSLPLGRSQAHAFDMKPFVELTSELLRNNIYAWLSKPPPESERVYRK